MTGNRALHLYTVVGSLIVYTGAAEWLGQSSSRFAMTLQTARSAEMEKPRSIGVATMRQDRTIVLDLTATGPNMLGDARLTYAPHDPNYSSILRHLGGLNPGEVKQVAPWDDQGR
jgi:hypothetical protein